MVVWSCIVRMLVLARPNQYWYYERNTNKPIHNKPNCDAKLLALEILLIFAEGLALAVA
jgi:hypothetical protein